MSALAGGVFAATDAQDDEAQLRQLVDDLGRRSYDAGLGHRGIPDQFDAQLWRHLEDAGFAASPRLVGSGLDTEGREVLTFIDGEYQLLVSEIYESTGL